MNVGRAVGVAVQMEMRGTITVRVHVQVPAPARVPDDHGAAEANEEQRDEKVSGWPEPVGQMEPEQHDYRHHHANTRRVPERPREPEPAGIEQATLSGGERRHRSEVVGLERVTESE